MQAPQNYNIYQINRAIQALGAVDLTNVQQLDALAFSTLSANNAITHMEAASMCVDAAYAWLKVILEKLPKSSEEFRILLIEKTITLLGMAQLRCTQAINRYTGNDAQILTDMFKTYLPVLCRYVALNESVGKYAAEQEAIQSFMECDAKISTILHPRQAKKLFKASIDEIAETTPVCFAIYEAMLKYVDKECINLQEAISKDNNNRFLRANYLQHLHEYKQIIRAVHTKFLNTSGNAQQILLGLIQKVDGWYLEMQQDVDAEILATYTPIFKAHQVHYWGAEARPELVTPIPSLQNLRRRNPCFQD